MRVTSIANHGEFVEVVYANEEDIDIDAGVITTHSVRLSEEVVEQDLVDEFDELGKRLLDIARRKRFGVADEFKAGAQ
jgi:hypothetical protein